jgi:hypothetical protein
MGQMNQPATLEALFAGEVIDRFLGGEGEIYRQAVKTCRKVKFDAQSGAIVLECPNAFLASMMESLRRELEAIAAPTGAQIQIVVKGKGKCYW